MQEKLIKEIQLSNPDNVIRICVVTQKNKKKYVDIRRYWKPEGSDNFIATQKGVQFQLTSDQAKEIMEGIISELNNESD